MCGDQPEIVSVILSLRILSLPPQNDRGTHFFTGGLPLLPSNSICPLKLAKISQTLHSSICASLWFGFPELSWRFIVLIAGCSHLQCDGDSCRHSMSRSQWTAYTASHVLPLWCCDAGIDANNVAKNILVTIFCCRSEKIYCGNSDKQMKMEEANNSHSK